MDRPDAIETEKTSKELILECAAAHNMSVKELVSYAYSINGKYGQEFEKLVRAELLTNCKRLCHRKLGIIKKHTYENNS